MPERWQSGRMRVFAKDVSGQKLDRGFESRPLRSLVSQGFATSRGTSRKWRSLKGLHAGRANPREPSRAVAVPHFVPRLCRILCRAPQVPKPL